MSRKVINVVTGGGSNIKYYDTSNVSSENSIYVEILAGFVSLLVKTAENNIGTAYAIVQQGSITDSFVAIAVNLETIIAVNGTLMSMENYLKSLSDESLGSIYDFLLSLPEITEEQFYDLTLPTE